MNKEWAIIPPDGYIIDKENSKEGKIVFKAAKKDIYMQDIYVKLDKDSVSAKFARLNHTNGFHVSMGSEIILDIVNPELKKCFCYACLQDIAKYYNQHYTSWKEEKYTPKYYIYYDKIHCNYGVENDDIINKGVVYFENPMDAKAVIENPNFRLILNTLFKPE